MKKILIPENAGDLRVVSDMLNQSFKEEDDPNHENTSMEAVVVFPNVDHAMTNPWAKWCVVDNRDHRAFAEDFATLDGALIYATGIQTTCEHQDAWDKEGAFERWMRLSLRKKEKDEVKDKNNTEPIARWDDEEDDHEELQMLFVKSVTENPNGQHTVRYLTEEHDNGDGTRETEHLVEITFLNACGPMERVDNALESMNGYDWRMVCDRFLNARLREVGADPHNFDWPMPDVRVTLDYYEDEDDVTKTATLVWAVDERTWRRCNPESFGAAGREEAWDGEAPVTEWCPHCDHEVTMEWNAKKYGYVAYCPHCGGELMLCDECRHSGDNPDGKCAGRCFRKRGKENENGDGDKV